MFTDVEVIKLHNDKRYRKSNGFCKNVRLSHSIVKSGVGGISVSISTIGTISLSVSVISLFWVALRYKFITSELTSCRAKIIESLLNSNVITTPEELVESSIGIGNMWLEYNRHKIDVIRRACLEYIETPEYRVILSEYSHISDRDTLTQLFKNVRAEIERIFMHSNDTLVQKEIKDAMANYSTALDNEKCAIMFQEIFMTNSSSGNLTTPNDNEEDI